MSYVPERVAQMTRTELLKELRRERLRVRDLLRRERDRSILALMREGLHTQEAIGRRFGLTGARVRQIVTEARRRPGADTSG